MLLDASGKVHALYLIEQRDDVTVELKSEGNRVVGRFLSEFYVHALE
jgi:hypothetical protein